MSDGEELTPYDLTAEALEQYERAAALIRRGVVSYAELEREVVGDGEGRLILGYDAVPAEWPVPLYSPLRNLFRLPGAAEKRAAEERARREWIEGIRRRLGLVAEVHRCRAWKCGDGDWGWFCLRRGCGEVGHFLPSQAKAVAKAQEHTRAFVPQSPEEGLSAEPDWAGYVPLLDALPWLVPGGE